MSLKAVPRRVQRARHDALFAAGVAAGARPDGGPSPSPPRLRLVGEAGRGTKTRGTRQSPALLLTHKEIG